MSIEIDDILAFVFDDAFEKKHPELAKRIRTQKQYKILVKEIILLKDRYQELDRVKEILQEQTNASRKRINEVLKKKNDRK